jgi:hypothetical protein
MVANWIHAQVPIEKEKKKKEEEGNTSSYA